MMDVLEHVDDDRGLAAHYAAKVPGGAHFLVTVPALASCGAATTSSSTISGATACPRSKATLRDAGLTIVRGAYYFGLVFPLAAAVRLASRGDTQPRSSLRGMARLPTGFWRPPCAASCRSCRSIGWRAVGFRVGEKP